MSDDSPPFLKVPSTTSQEEAEIAAELARLSSADRRLAEAQRFCPISEGSRLGSMGKPVKLTIEGQTVFVCCEGCEEDAHKQSKQTLAKVKRLVRENNAGR